MALGDAHAPRVPPTPGCKYVARERLDMGPGYIIEPGQPFDPVLFSMTDLQAELWWSAAILDVAPPVPPAVDPATPEPVVAEPTPQARPSKRR